MKKIVLYLAVIIALVTAEGVYHQEYNYQTSASEFKNNELVHKTDDQGYYRKHGDLEGRVRPKISSNSEHSEYVNPTYKNNGYYDGASSVGDLTSQGNLLAANNYGAGNSGLSQYESEGAASGNFIGGAGYSGSSGAYHAGSESSSYTNLQTIISRLQNDLQNELRSTISRSSSHQDLGLLEEELRRNLTERLQTILEERFGSQTIRGGSSYSLVAGRLQSRPNYEQQELERLQQQIERSLLDELRREYRYKTNYNNNNNQQQNYERYESTTTYRPSTYRTIYPSLNSVGVGQEKYANNNYGVGKTSHYEYSGRSESRIQHSQAPNVVSMTTIASNVQRDLNEQLNRLIEKAQRDYFSENAQYANYDQGLAQLKQDLHRNLTYYFDEELRRNFGSQLQRDGYMYSVGPSGVPTQQYNYPITDLENYRRQVEENLLTKLTRDFESAKQHWISQKQSQSQQSHQYNQYEYGQTGQANYGSASTNNNNQRYIYSTPRYISEYSTPARYITDDYHNRPTSPSIIPLISSGVKGYQNSASQLQTQLQTELSRQLQAALTQNQAYSNRYSASSGLSSASSQQLNFDEAYRRLYEELQRNLTEQLQSFETGAANNMAGGYSSSLSNSFSNNQLEQMRSQLQNNLASQLQAGLMKTYSASASYSASSSHGASGAFSSSAGNSGDYYRAARGSGGMHQYGSSNSAANCYSCQEDSSSHLGYRVRRSYRSRPLGLSTYSGAGGAYNSNSGRGSTYGGYSTSSVGQEEDNSEIGQQKVIENNDNNQQIAVKPTWSQIGQVEDDDDYDNSQHTIDGHLGWNQTGQEEDNTDDDRRSESHHNSLNNHNNNNQGFDSIGLGSHQRRNNNNNNNQPPKNSHPSAPLNSYQTIRNNNNNRPQEAFNANQKIEVVGQIEDKDDTQQIIDDSEFTNLLNVENQLKPIKPTTESFPRPGINSGNFPTHPSRQQETINNNNQEDRVNSAKIETNFNVDQPIYQAANNNNNNFKPANYPPFSSFIVPLYKPQHQREINGQEAEEQFNNYPVKPTTTKKPQNNDFSKHSLDSATFSQVGQEIDNSDTLIDGSSNNKPYSSYGNNKPQQEFNNRPLRDEILYSTGQHQVDRFDATSSTPRNLDQQFSENFGKSTPRYTPQQTSDRYDTFFTTARNLDQQFAENSGKTTPQSIDIFTTRRIKPLILPQQAYEDGFPAIIGSPSLRPNFIKMQNLIEDIKATLTIKIDEILKMLLNAKTPFHQIQSFALNQINEYIEKKFQYLYNTYHEQLNFKKENLDIPKIVAQEDASRIINNKVKYFKNIPYNHEEADSDYNLFEKFQPFLSIVALDIEKDLRAEIKNFNNIFTTQRQNNELLLQELEKIVTKRCEEFKGDIEKPEYSFLNIHYNEISILENYLKSRVQMLIQKNSIQKPLQYSNDFLQREINNYHQQLEVGSLVTPQIPTQNSQFTPSVPIVPERRPNNLENVNFQPTSTTNRYENRAHINPNFSPPQEKPTFDGQQPINNFYNNAENEANRLINILKSKTDRITPQSPSPTIPQDVQTQVITVKLENVTKDQLKLITQIEDDFFNLIDSMVQKEYSSMVDFEQDSRYVLYYKSLDKLEEEIKRKLADSLEARIPTSAGEYSYLNKYSSLVYGKFEYKKVADVQKYLEIRLIKHLRAQLKKSYNFEEETDSKNSSPSSPSSATTRRVVKLENITPQQLEVIQVIEQDIFTLIETDFEHQIANLANQQLSNYKYREELERIQTEYFNRITEAVQRLREPGFDQHAKLVACNFDFSKLNDLEDYLLIRLKNKLRGKVQFSSSSTAVNNAKQGYHHSIQYHHSLHSSSSSSSYNNNQRRDEIANVEPARTTYSHQGGIKGGYRPVVIPVEEIPQNTVKFEPDAEIITQLTSEETTQATTPSGNWWSKFKKGAAQFKDKIVGKSN